MSEVLIEVSRGELIECKYRGDIAVVDKNGVLLYYVGDPYKVTYSRSSAKPIQAMEVFFSGAYDEFRFTDSEIAIMCASHYAEKFHIRSVKSILDKIGLDENNLLCGTTSSMQPEYALELAKRNVKLNPMYNDCSGKHAGMLSVCVKYGYDIHSYKQVEHPLQESLKEHIAYIYDINEKDIIVAIDGCDVPVFGMPLYNLALAYARFTNPDVLRNDYQKIAEKIFDCMNNHPEMIAGTGGFCTELIKNTNRKLIGKLGAEGVYCVGLKDKGIGIAIKIEDGNIDRAIPTSAVHTLNLLKVLTEEEAQSLSNFRVMDNLNATNTIVGKIYPVFNLLKKD